MCNEEAASVEAASKRWAGKATFVGVAWSGTDADFQRFIDRHQLTFAQISDDDGEVFGRFEITAQPGFAVVGTQGQVGSAMGAVSPDSLDGAIRQAGG